MSGLRLLTADMRRAEKRGPKVLIVGIPGIGKTSLLSALALETLGETLLVDAEAGDLAVAGLPIASVRPRTWPEVRDIAAAVGGANPARPTNATYSQAHYDAVVANPDMAELTRYSVVFIDSLTEISRDLPGMGRTAAGEPFRPREKGPTRDLRPRRAGVDRHAAADAARTRENRHLRQRARAGHRRLRRLTLGNPARRATNRARAARHRRRSDHHALRRFRRRQAAVRAFVCTAPTRGASPRRTDPVGSLNSRSRISGKLLEKLTRQTHKRENENGDRFFGLYQRRPDPRRHDRGGADAHHVRRRDRRRAHAARRPATPKPSRPSSRSSKANSRSESCSPSGSSRARPTARRAWLSAKLRDAQAHHRERQVPRPERQVAGNAR